jgi:hypothetical protein
VAFALSSVRGQENKSGKPEPATRVINLWPGVRFGSEQWKEMTMGSGGTETTVNVVTPTLTAYLPDAAVATARSLSLPVEVSSDRRSSRKVTWIQQNGWCHSGEVVIDQAT